MESVLDLASYRYVHAAKVNSTTQYRHDGSTPSPSPSTPRTLPATPESSPFRSLCSPELSEELDRASVQSAGSPRSIANHSLSPTKEAGETMRRSQSLPLSSLTTKTHSLQKSLSSDQRGLSNHGVGCTRHSPMLEALQVCHSRLCASSREDVLDSFHGPWHFDHTCPDVA